jgi:hypothetical protein
METAFERFERHIAQLDPKGKAELDKLLEPLRKQLWIPDPRNMLLLRNLCVSERRRSALPLDRAYELPQR